MLHVSVCFAVMCVPFEPCGHLLEMADLLAIMFVVFCYFPKCVLVHIRIKGRLVP